MGSPVQERHGYTGVSPGQEHRDDEGTAAADMGGEAESML